MQTSNAHVRYVDDIHAYYNSTSGKRYISVTQLLKLFEQGFDGDYWSLYKAVQRHLGIEEKSDFSAFMRKYGINFRDKSMSNLHQTILKVGYQPKFFAQLALDILYEWEDNRDKKATRGSNFHDRAETQAYTDGFIKLGTEKHTTQTSYSYDLSQLTDGSYAEILLYTHEYEVAGKADVAILETLKTEGGYVTFADIDDHKTNDKLTFGNEWQKFKYPINHIEECKHNHHTLQLSTYMYMLELNGFKPRHIQYTHRELNDNGELVRSTPYKLQYMRQEVISMLTHYKQVYC